MKIHRVSESGHVPGNVNVRLRVHFFDMFEPFECLSGPLCAIKLHLP